MAKKRKTKKEKIISKLRRELKTKQLKPAHLKEELPSSKPIEVRERSSHKEIVKEEKVFLTNEAGLIKKDLIRGLLLSLLVISFELVIYWFKILG